MNPNDAEKMMAQARAMQERLEEAIALWTRAEAMDRRLRPGTPGHLTLLEDLASAKAMLGDEAGARALRDDAARLRQPKK